MDLFFSDAFKGFLNSYSCVCVPLNCLTCEKNGVIEMQHNNNNNTTTVSIQMQTIYSSCNSCVSSAYY